jgi:HD-like signal output (HDOD) protein
MGEPQIPHVGITLDVINLTGLGRKASGREVSEIPSDPSDYKVFVNSILKKMSTQDSFISFSKQINDVNKILNMKYSSANDIAQVILKDIALTSKMLKLVNSSFYCNFTSRGISTISEAMIILGTDEIRLAAASLKIYETMKDLSNTKILAKKALNGLQRGLMARQIALEGGYDDPDALQVSAMIYDLGEYLVALFSPDKYIKIEIAMDDNAISRQMAAKSILGISYNSLGRIAALKLHLPENIVHAMKPIVRFDLKLAQINGRDRNRYVCSFTRELCDIPVNAGKTKLDRKAGLIADKYYGILNLEMVKAVELLNTSREKIVKHAALLNIGKELDQV